ncbi:MAG: acryloyl-CoA reductase [Candidatus Puniceispirillaceae bacterium]
MFKALIVSKSEETPFSAAIQEVDQSFLSDEGEVLVKVAYSTVNYKDGLVLNGKGGLVRDYPRIPGIDFSGTVESSRDSRYQPGDKVILTGWRVGEAWHGGYAHYAKVKADWLVPLPEGLSLEQAMAVGTAGLTAVFAIQALEAQGLQPDKGPVLVTGVSGGVGSVAAAMLKASAYEVAGVTGRAASMQDYLTSLGVSEIIERAEIAEAIARPMESARWAGCIDSVGGEMLARILGQLQYGASAAAIGNAGGVAVPANIIPFLLRGVNLLGIDSVMRPYAERISAWDRIAKDMPHSLLADMTDVISLDDVPEAGKQILSGQVKGRLVVDVQNS